MGPEVAVVVAPFPLILHMEVELAEAAELEYAGHQLLAPVALEGLVYPAMKLQVAPAVEAGLAELVVTPEKTLSVLQVAGKGVATEAAAELLALTKMGTEVLAGPVAVELSVSFGVLVGLILLTQQTLSYEYSF